MNPILSFELLFFAVFGQTTTDQTQIDKMTPNTTRTQPYWTEYLFKIVFGIYMLVSVVVLINLLIAMMSDTYQRIQVSLSIKCSKLWSFLPCPVSPLSLISIRLCILVFLKHTLLIDFLTHWLLLNPFFHILPLVYTTTPTPLLPVLNISVCSLFW